MNRLVLWSARATPLDAFVTWLFDTQLAMQSLDWSLRAMCVSTLAGPERLLDRSSLEEELLFHASGLGEGWRGFAPDHMVKLSNDRKDELRAEIFARRWDARDKGLALTEVEVVIGGETERARSVLDLWLDSAAALGSVDGYVEPGGFRARALRASEPHKVGWMTIVPSVATDLPALPPFVRQRALPSGGRVFIIGDEPLGDRDEDRANFMRAWEVLAPALERARSMSRTTQAVPATRSAPVAPPPPALVAPPVVMPAPVIIPAPVVARVARPVTALERALGLAIDVTRVASVESALRAEGLQPEQWIMTVNAYAARMTLTPRLREAVLALGGRASNAIMAPAVAMFATAETAFERAIHLAVAIASGVEPREALIRVGLEREWEEPARAFADALKTDPELAARLMRAGAALDGARVAS